jgi:hypothetical protein
MPCDLYGSVPGDRGGRMGMTEPSRRERYLKALEIAERLGNRFMAQNIRAELRKLDAEPNYPAKPDSSTITL